MLGYDGEELLKIHMVICVLINKKNNKLDMVYAKKRIFFLT